MTRNLKILGLATVAVLALGAMAASAAQAEKYTAAQYPASLQGKQTTQQVLTFNGGRKFECTGVTASGTLAEASEQIQTTSELSGCTTEIAGTKWPSKTTVSCGGIYKHITALSITETICTSGYTHHVGVYKDAAMTEPLCVYNIEDLGSFKGISHENLGGTKGVKITYNLGGIAYKLIAGTAFLCGAESSTATYTGAATFTAKSESEAITFDVG
jgi:hypothetical protein